MKKLPKRILIGLVASGVALGALLLYVEVRFGALRTAPEADRNAYVEEPGLIAVFRPEKAADAIGDIIRENSGMPVPQWLIKRALPREVSFITASDHDSSAMQLTLFVNPTRFGKLIHREVNRAELLDRFPELRWNAAGLERTGKGALLAQGAVPMEPEAQETAWLTWNQSFKPTPLKVSGDHLLEIAADNRDGGAYLAVASLLDAYDIEINEREHDVSLSSLQFVVQTRAYVDIVGDSLTYFLAIDVAPEAVNRLGVINLKVAIGKLFDYWAERLREEHGIKMRGAVRWNGATMEFKYRVEEARKVLNIAMDNALETRTLHARSSL